MKEFGGPLIILILILSILNTAEYTHHASTISSSNIQWGGPCSMERSDRAKQECLQKETTEKHKAEAYMDSFGSIANFSAIAFIIISIIVLIKVPKIIYKVLGIITILVNAVMLIL